MIILSYAWGTNDSKKMFDSRQREVSENLKVLLAKIKEAKLCRSGKTKFIYVTPPPLRVKMLVPNIRIQVRDWHVWFRNLRLWP